MKRILAISMLMVLAVSMAGVSAQVYSSSYLKETFLNQKPDPAEPGKYVELRWKVQKFGNTQLDNISYYLDVEYPFYFDQSDTPTRG
jgi:hypothetical protein